MGRASSRLSEIGSPVAGSTLPRPHSIERIERAQGRQRVTSRGDLLIEQVPRMDHIRP
jgi:hypothetical protein